MRRFFRFGICSALTVNSHVAASSGNKSDTRLFRWIGPCGRQWSRGAGALGYNFGHCGRIGIRCHSVRPPLRRSSARRCPS